MSIQQRRAAHRAARRLVGAGAISIVAALAIASVAMAHGETFFQLGAERVQPGGTVEIRADLGAGDAFEVTLVAKDDGTRRSLGSVPATEEGHLQGFLTIPPDVQAGDYLVELAYDLTVLRAPLTVAGAAIDGEQGGAPDQGEGLIVPIPSSAASGGVRAASAAPSTTAPARPGRTPVDGALIAAVALGAAALLLVGLRIAMRRKGAAIS